MIKQIRPYHLILLLTVLCCRKPYTPKVIEVDYSYLVINGVINVGNNVTTIIQLSRTQRLTDTAISNPESGASVMIEAQSGNRYALAATANGTYESAPLTLNATTTYRLRITDKNGDTYSSDYVAVKQTPPVDSVSWKQDTTAAGKNAVTIYVHTHDPSNNTKYYRWDYVETWQYHAPLDGSWALLNGRTIYYLDTWQHLYYCYGTIYSPNISTATSANLSQDVISYVPVNKIEQDAYKLMLRYSINVKQYGLTKEAYDYWQLLEKSSQQTGSIFDPQPAQLKGNIHCENIPGKPVLGYASASAVTEKRIFIDNRELWHWKSMALPNLECKLGVTSQDPVDFTRYNYFDTTWGPFFYASGGGLVIAKKDCLDCRRYGGDTTKPAFWR